MPGVSHLRILRSIERARKKKEVLRHTGISKEKKKREEASRHETEYEIHKYSIPAMFPSPPNIFLDSYVF